VKAEDTKKGKIMRVNTRRTRDLEETRGGNKMGE
jgi:hypothetical protein